MEPALSSQLFLGANRSSPHQAPVGDNVSIGQTYYNRRQRKLGVGPPVLRLDW